ncbi:MAG: hypothetical protein K2L15_03550 [Eubacteriales bacterium]|nr:hypothetical protein [Eubacteriales bacterium]
MQKKQGSCEKQEVIADIYFNEIMPKIKEIDTILKERKTILFEDAAKLLEIEETELLEIMRKINIKKIKPENFLLVMLNGSSFICQILKREIECGSPYFYSPKEISYIYNLDEKKVLNAFEFLDMEFVTTNQIPTILIQIN